MKLRAAREASGKTQTQVANESGIAVTSYQRHEAGARVPNAYTVNKLAQVLRSTVEELFPAAPGATATHDNRNTYGILASTRRN